jgi:ArsR family transcriptional regulator, arsenate/arsenite/antimonite-responsive transcriptional repressor
MKSATKREFPDKTLKLAEFAKAMSHPARIAILQTLAEKKECICGDLVVDLPLAQATVSQHLKVLKELDLIKGEINGPRSKYCINWSVFEKYQKQLGNWAEYLITLRQDNCC